MKREQLILKINKLKNQINTFDFKNKPEWICNEIKRKLNFAETLFDILYN